MTYRIEFAPSAAREYRKLPADMVARIREAVDALARDPRPPGATKLKGEARAYRVRVDDWRILYEIFDRTVIVRVLRIGHRRDVYR